MLLFRTFLVCALFGAFALPGWAESKPWIDSLTFHASFDDSTDADFGSGDLRMYTTLSRKMEDAALGQLREDVSLDSDGGKYGGALKFTEHVPPLLLYKVEGNMDYQKKDWSGTISFWLRLDPDEDLEPGFCDPILITDKDWDNASIFVDFTKDDVPRKFRGGFFCDKTVWNPKGLGWDDVPEEDQPFIVVDNPPFGHEEWTHVVISFNKVNTGDKNGSAKLYMNGVLSGALEGREQTFTWNPSEAWMKIGYNYIGWFDELALFNRELSADEIRELYRLDGGIASLRAR